jgi:hypothetical protein
MDGPLDLPVTITATDPDGAQGVGEFTLRVANVAPTSWTTGPAFVPVKSKSSRTFIWSVSDAPADTPEVTTTCGSGTKVQEAPWRIDGQRFLRCTFATAGSTKVGPQATDKDGASADGRMTTVATTAVRSMADGRIVVDGAAEGDYTGSSLAVVDLDRDGKGDVVAGSSAPMYAAPPDDHVAVVRGRSDAAQFSLATPPAGTTWTITGPAGERFGYVLANAGDVNGDGWRDLIVGSLSRAWVVYARAGFAGVDVEGMTEAQGFSITGLVTFDPSRQPLAGVGDTNADGFDDIAVASLNVEGMAGVVTVILGRATSGGIDVSAPPAGRAFTIRTRSGRTGSAMAGGDINGDGRSDIVVTGPGGPYSSAVVVYGRAAPVNVEESSMTATQGFVISGGATIGMRAVAVGDMDADGYGDIGLAHDGVGWPASIIRGRATNSSIPYVQDATTTRLLRVTGTTAGVTRAAMGDVNGDGKADLLLGSPGTDSLGSTWIIKGSAPLAHVNVDALSSRWARIDGDAEMSLAGAGVAAGDVSGDRVTDIVLGAEGGVNWSVVDRGRISIFAGTSPTDTTAPSITGPRLTLAEGTVGPLVPVRVRWSASDNKTGISRVEVQRQTDGGPWTSLGATSTEGWTNRWLATGHTYRFRARATDGAGNRSAWAYGTTRRLSGYSESNDRVTWRGSWTMSTDGGWWGGKARSATAAGARATIQFTGTAIEWIAAVGPDQGKARVVVDGVTVATVDLKASTVGLARSVFRKSWTSSGTHTLRVEVLGTTGRPRVDVDGFVAIR